MDSIIGTSELSRPGSAAAQLKWWVHNNGATVFGRRRPSSLSGAAVPEKRHGKILQKTLVTRKIFATQDHTISI